MPISFFTGTDAQEQAVGATLYNGNMRLYAVRRDDPLNMIFLGGHRISDALTYNITEAVMIPEYVSVDGENTVLEVFVSDDTVKSIQLNLELPNKSIPAAMRILQSQKNCTYDLLFVPEDCNKGCEEFFWLGRNLRLGAVQITAAPVGFDDTKTAITRISVGRVTGNLLQYNGMVVKELGTAAAALYTSFIDDEDLCADCGCPYQNLYRGGAAIADVSNDGGTTWTALNVAAIANGTNITEIKKSGGRILAGHSDVIDAAGTTGGVAYLVGTAFVEGTMLNAAGVAVTPSIQAVVPTGGSTVYAFGSLAGAPYIMKSCDSGLNWTEEAVIPATLTNPILDADYDPISGNMYIGSTGGQFHVWDFKTWTNETFLADGVTARTAGDILSVEVNASGSILYGTSTGEVWENHTYTNLGGTWKQSEQLVNAIQASSGDVYAYRTILSSGVELYNRDGNTKQITESLATFNAIVRYIDEGKSLLDEGTAFFLGVNEDGVTWIASQCNLCIESCA